MSHLVIVLTTTAEHGHARNIARVLVERRLAACVQIVGKITSVYAWQGRVQEDDEFLCVIKSRSDLYDRLEHCLRDVHPYDVPEIVCVEAERVSHDYWDWLTSVTGESEGSEPTDEARG